MENKILQNNIETTLNFLKNKKKILFVTTSNRFEVNGEGEKAKSSKIAYFLQEKLGSEKVKIIDINSLKIYNCLGHISGKTGNSCGLKTSCLNDKEKNPSGYHRCWMNITNSEDELWKVSKDLFESDSVIFFTSVRRGQTNALYQKLIERLSFIENRHSNLKEDNIIAHIEAGIVVIGHNWYGKNVLETQKQVLDFYGFKTPGELSWNWQYTEDIENEDSEAYKDDVETFEESLEKFQANNKTQEEEGISFFKKLF